MNFNDICCKNLLQDNVKCQQKLRLHFLSKKYNFGKTNCGRGQINIPSLSWVNKVTRPFCQHYWNKDTT